MKIFFSFCTFIACIIIILFLLYVIKYLFNVIVFKIKNDKNQKYAKKFLPSYIFKNDSKKSIWLFRILAIFFIIGIIYMGIITFYPSKQIGSTLEGTSYEANYYVNLFENNKDAANYRVIGKIKAETDDNKKSYYLKKIYLNNGSSISFNNYSELNELKVNKRVLLTDDNNKEWYVELTTQRAK